MKNPAAVLALALAGLWVLSWILFLAVAPGARLAGVPWITWSQILLAAGSIGASLLALPLLERWERR